MRGPVPGSAPARAGSYGYLQGPYWPRVPPVRTRLSVADHWLEIRISEGRNRQVRRMTAAVGLPTLRLVRVAIGEHPLRDLASGAWRTL